MLYSLFLHKDAQDDLESLWEENEEAAATIHAVLEQIQGDQHLLDSLTVHEYGSRPETAGFHVSKWIEQWKQHRDLWRLKVWSLEETGLQYRVIYAYLPGKRVYYVLGIVPRNFDYDPSHPLAQRIINAYRKLSG